ncbi:MAG: hypothetical protein KAG14_02815 [Mycoplasmataceae bacterium]|nr:hypothetical protein [Mycoplasmataceae bacterium]
MKTLNFGKNEIKELISDADSKTLLRIVKFIKVNLIEDPSKYDHKMQLQNKKKSIAINFLVNCFKNPKFKEKFYLQLIKNTQLRELYRLLVWEDEYYHIDEIYKEIGFKKPKVSVYEEEEQIELLNRITRFNHDNTIKYDVVALDKGLRQILRMIFPIPDDYDIKGVDNPSSTEFSYNNEDNILDFISTMDDLLKAEIIKFSKSGEKPLEKTLNILKSSTITHEFYTNDKGKMESSLAINSLIRSFYFYDMDYRNDKYTSLTKLKDFVNLQFKDKVSFSISRIFTHYLKGIRFDPYYRVQSDLFTIVSSIFKKMPKDAWTSVDNILKSSSYHDDIFHFEPPYKTKNYYIETDTEIVYINGTYKSMFFNPIVKAVFFYLASLGLLEIKYDTPVSELNISLRDKEYLSLWDGLKYIKLTKLGKFIFNFEKKYNIKEKKHENTNMHFDEHKPIITISSNDALSLAKIENYTEKYDENKYILNYAKIFKGCETYKTLNIKIDSFYKQIEQNPPKVFKDFFNKIKKQANKLQEHTDNVVIEIKNDQELLNLFMNNKKLQDLIIKAQGYRIIVLKTNISKLTKILKDNGFFVDF